MKTSSTKTSVFSMAPALLVYFALVVALLLTAQQALLDLYKNMSALSEAHRLLGQLEQRSSSIARFGESAGSNPPRSIFLEGPTVTVAGAALQRRISDAVGKVGGTVLSTNTDLQNSQTKDGDISLSTDCEMDQSSIQPFLYDLESGFPLLFVDSLAIQSRTEEQIASQMHIQIVVSGKWRAR